MSSNLEQSSLFCKNKTYIHHMQLHLGQLKQFRPLVLIDGISGQLDGINPNEIQSISIPQDAPAQQ